MKRATKATGLPPTLRSALFAMMALGPVEARRMFGGYGVFLDGLMFALYAGNALYLKSDAESDARFRAAGSHPFTYERKGRSVALSYWRVPAAAEDDAQALLDWAELALAAARRKQKTKKDKTKR